MRGILLGMERRKGVLGMGGGGGMIMRWELWEGEVMLWR